LSSTTWSLPAAEAIATARSISASVAMPVEMISGLPVRATRSTSR
jgi:hypothetical protein